MDFHKILIPLLAYLSLLLAVVNCASHLPVKVFRNIKIILTYIILVKTLSENKFY
jgi:hypothetical protein